MYKGLTAYEKEIIYKPRSGTEMEHATLNKVPIYKYSDLCTLGKKHGATKMLSNMFRNNEDAIILLQDPSDMSSGHWLSVSRRLPKKEMYFFSTYGGKPDIEKLEWLNDDDLLESGQDMNIFQEGLRNLQKHGWVIHYNDHPYQFSGDKTATCGIYTAAFIRSGKNPDEFYRDTKRIASSGINPAVYYYEKYFI